LHTGTNRKSIRRGWQRTQIAAPAGSTSRRALRGGLSLQPQDCKETGGIMLAVARWALPRGALQMRDE
jgi:hypothetical protein